MSNAAHKRSRDIDENNQATKRVKEHNSAEKIDQQAASTETFCRAPLIEGASVWHNEIVKISTKDFLQVCNTVLLFYDYDFTPTAARDLRTLNNLTDKISALNARALAISVDTEHCHYAFLQREFPASAAAKFPLVADTTKRITHDFHVLDEATGVARRSLIVVDKNGEIRYWSVLQHHEIDHNFDGLLSVLKHLP
ncbi:thioredoxin-like protein [Umbelopsis sp. PMI_123]|nr:thioredoxin-like protein [Umbelopsis sp. PMI_123]